MVTPTFNDTEYRKLEARIRAPRHRFARALAVVLVAMAAVLVGR